MLIEDMRFSLAKDWLIVAENIRSDNMIFMYETRSVTEIARHFANYINRVVYRGERFVLVRGNKPVAELGPLPAGKRLGELPELLRSLPRLPEDEAAEFSEDLAGARSGLSSVEVRDPWES